MNLRSKKEKLEIDLYNEIDLYKLNNRMEYALDSDSIKFYEKLKPKPKCLECGYNKLYEKPKHTCGGDIYIETDKRIRFNIGISKKFHLVYDEYGNVI